MFEGVVRDQAARLASQINQTSVRRRPFVEAEHTHHLTHDTLSRSMDEAHTVSSDG